MDTVTLKISWEKLLGLGPRGTSIATRRQRWAAWLRLARREDRGVAAFWDRGFEMCWACAHRRGGWCELAALPCTVNPYTTIRHGHIGMACMGVGFRPRQLVLPGMMPSKP